MGSGLRSCQKTVSTEGLPDFKVWDGVISRAICAKTIAAMTWANKAPGKVLRHGTNHTDFDMRVCIEHYVPSDESKYIIDALQIVARQVLSSEQLEGVRLDGPKFCSYAKGGHFKLHKDRSSDTEDPQSIRARVLSLVCLLNDGSPLENLPVFDGGTLVLYVAKSSGTLVPVNIPLSAGSIVAFSSNLFHEVRPVRGGVRFSAVAWLYEAQ